MFVKPTKDSNRFRLQCGGVNGRVEPTTIDFDLDTGSIVSKAQGEIAEMSSMSTSIKADNGYPNRLLLETHDDKVNTGCGRVDSTMLAEYDAVGRLDKISVVIQRHREGTADGVRTVLNGRTFAVEGSKVMVFAENSNGGIIGRVSLARADSVPYVVVGFTELNAHEQYDRHSKEIALLPLIIKCPQDLFEIVKSRIRANAGFFDTI
jgi:hypothetical protein